MICDDKNIVLTKHTIVLRELNEKCLQPRTIWLNFA